MGENEAEKNAATMSNLGGSLSGHLPSSAVWLESDAEVLAIL